MNKSSILLVTILLSQLSFCQQKANYTVTENYDTTFHLFKPGERIRISAAEGLAHYRNGKLVNQYKIIGEKKKQQAIAPCEFPPCPEFVREIFVYYSEYWQRYISVVDLPDRSWFRVTKTLFPLDTVKTFREGDWITWYRLKKLND